MSNLGKNLKTIRDKRKLSQSKLAFKLDVDQGQISVWERGLVEPKIDTAIKIADTINVTLDELCR